MPECAVCRQDRAGREAGLHYGITAQKGPATSVVVPMGVIESSKVTYRILGEENGWVCESHITARAVRYWVGALVWPPLFACIGAALFQNAKGPSPTENVLCCLAPWLVLAVLFFFGLIGMGFDRNDLADGVLIARLKGELTRSTGADKFWTRREWADLLKKQQRSG